MNTILTVEDPLADQGVTIVMTLATSQLPRDERPILISLGLPEQLPVIKTGLLADALSLIQEAWTAFGLRVQLAEAIVEETVVITTNTTEDTPVLATPPPTVAPRPQAKNLSLF